MVDLKCPKCESFYDKFWTNGLTDRGFIYCQQCHCIVFIEQKEYGFSDYSASGYEVASKVYEIATN